MAYVYAACAVHVTTFSTGSTVRPVSNFTVLTPTTHSYVLLHTPWSLITWQCPWWSVWSAAACLIFSSWGGPESAPFYQTSPVPPPCVIIVCRYMYILVKSRHSSIVIVVSVLHWNFGMASFVETSSTIKSRATCTAIFLASLYVLLSAALFPTQPGPGNKAIFHAHIIYLCMYTVTCT